MKREMKRNDGRFKALFIVFPLLLIFLLPSAVSAKKENKKEDKKESKREKEIGGWIDFGYWTNGDFTERHAAALLNREYAHRSFEHSRKDIDSSREMKIHRFHQENNIPPEIATDVIRVPKDGLRNRTRIKITPVELIEDGFLRLRSIFKVGQHTYFTLRGSIQKENKLYDDDGNMKVERKIYTGIYRLEGEGKYREINGTTFDSIVDMGNNRILGYNVSDPFKLYGFRENFEGLISIDLPDFQHRMGLHKISHKRFLFHNFRFSPYSHAVEIYDMKGKRVAQCFNKVPYDYSNAKHGLPLAEATKVTADGKGHFYIAAQYPLNPYRIWKYDGDGKLVKVFGNYFAHPDVYEFPDEWITEHGKRIRRYGLNRLYTVTRLLNDEHGRLYVVFECYKMKKAGSLSHEEKDPETYMDIYDPDGAFIGRTEFKYGMPELIHGDHIYAKDMVTLPAENARKTGWGIRILKLEM